MSFKICKFCKRIWYSLCNYWRFGVLSSTPIELVSNLVARNDNVRINGNSLDCLTVVIDDDNLGYIDWASSLSSKCSSNKLIYTVANNAANRYVGMEEPSQAPYPVLRLSGKLKK